jgi:Fe-S oxidoreductase
MACVEICPVGIEHVPLIIQLRRSLVDRGEMEPTLQGALQNIATQGNSFGKSARMRARWTKDLEIPIKDARKEPVEYLWFLGDFASFDDRLMALSRTLAQVLTSAGVSFGILYEDERNAGNDVRRIGEEGLFEMLVEQNLSAFAKASFDKIFTTDPHSFNTLRNEYPAYGLTQPVMHYSELLAALLYTGRMQPSQLGRRVTYHDPCYLGRYNRIFDAPRAVLGGLGCNVIEMPRHRATSFCCGAGGGRIWMDDSSLAERPSVNRIKEAAALGVDYFVVACPKDYTMFSDAAKTAGVDDRLKVVDLVELFAEATLASELVGA